MRFLKGARIAAVCAAYLYIRSRRNSAPRTGVHSSAEGMKAGTDPRSVSPEIARRKGADIPWPAALLLTSCSILISLFAYPVGHFLGYGRLGEMVALLVALSIICFVASGPKRRCNIIVFSISVTALLAQGASFLYVTWLAITSIFAGPLAMLEFALVGVFGAGIILVAAVSWLKGIHYIEPLAIGLLSLVLALLCLPGLQLLIQPESSPYVSGQALLFATGSSRQGLDLKIQADPIVGAPALETLDVENVSAHPIRWALLLIDDARLRNFKATPGRKPVSFGFEQIFSGYDGPHATAQMASGKSWVSFAGSGTDPAVVAFPSYAPGVLSNIDIESQRKIVTALGRKPELRISKAFSVSLSSTAFAAGSSIVQVRPAPSAFGTSAQGSLSWTSHTQLSPFFVAADPTSESADNDFLFVFAILMGVAGAGILASVQAAIHITLRSGGSDD
jgi:hypothetical protein